jgi:hypothetical protein
MPEPILPEHLSTLAYLWHQYEAQPRQLAFRAQTLIGRNLFRDRPTD